MYRNGLVFQCVSPSPGTPGEGRGEGLFMKYQPVFCEKNALTLTLSRSTRRGDQKDVCNNEVYSHTVHIPQ